MTDTLPRAVFAGCARDCAAHLPAVLRNIERMAGLFAESFFVFVENDSRDNTKALLSAWGADKPNFFFIPMDGLHQAEPVRTRRLEFARNVYTQLIRSSDLARFDYVVMLDLDEVNAEELDLDAFRRALRFLQETPDAAAAFANQRGTYYDMWALRHREVCPADVWEEVYDHAMRKEVTDERAYRETFAKRIFSLAEDGDPMEVDSAFGGLGIYRMKYVINNPNPYLGHKVKAVDRGATLQFSRWQTCEHVHFNRGIRSLGGRLFVLPWLVNRETGTGLEFPASACRSMLF
jgi:glycosyltransferase involved in cell wall biosynthesis